MTEKAVYAPVDVMLENVDWALLRQQKFDLLSRITDDDPLMGLVHFLDYIQDQVAKDLGEEAVFGPPPDETHTSTERNDNMTENTEYPLTLRIRPAVDPVEITDALNESLRELALAGAIDDTDDDGWKWEPSPVDEVDLSPRGRCDTCGAICDEQGCTTDRNHKIALDA